MEKVYGKPAGGAMRGAARCALACAVALTLGALPGPKARAADSMMLVEQPPPAPHTYGWIFTGLSLVSFGVAYNDYEEDEYNTAKAKQAYKKYQAATNSSDAVAYHQQTSTYIDHAKAYESTTNAALIIGSALAITAITIFVSGPPSNTPILLSDRGVEWTYRF